MEWMTLPTLWGVPMGMLEVWHGYRDQRYEEPGSEPTELDLSLVEALYEAIAAASTCLKCGASLGRYLRLVPSSRPAAGSGSWRLLVNTRCHGWWRHPYSAEVTEVPQGLRLGLFVRV